MNGEPITTAITNLRVATRALKKINHADPIRNIDRLTVALHAARLATASINGALNISLGQLNRHIQDIAQGKDADDTPQHKTTGPS